MKYLGDYAEDYATLNLKFSTHTSAGTPITLAGTPAVSVYKANGTTQSTAGITLTVDFDGVTGLHNVLIDLSADAFYATANDYAVVITTGTVDSVSVVGTVLAHFSIDNRSTTAIKTDTAAILVDTGTTLDARIPAALVGGRMDANLGAISTDATAADNAEAFFDGTGYAGTGNVIPTVTTLTNLPAITANWITAAGVTDGAFTAAKFAAGAYDAVWSVATRVLTAATNLTTALATPTNITAGTITTVSGNVTGSVGSIAAGGLTAASLDATVQARMGILGNGTAQSAAAANVVVAAGTGNLYKAGSVIGVIGTTQGYYQWRVIVSVSTDTLTVDAWDVTPSGAPITYVVFAAPPASATALPAVNVTQFGGAAGTFASGRPEVNTTHVGGTSQTAGNLTSLITTVDTVVDSILDDTGTAGVVVASGSKSGYSLTATTGLGNQTANITGNLSGSVGSVAAGGITAASIATGAIDADALAADTITAAKVHADVTTEIAAGVLAAAAADPIDANIEQINTVTITGDGSTTPFNV